MSNTINRLSNEDGLYVRDINTGSNLPLDIKTVTATSASVFSASVGGFPIPTMRLQLSSSYTFSPNDIIEVSGFSSASTVYNSLDGEKRVLSSSVVGGFTHVSASPVVDISWLTSASTTISPASTINVKHKYSYSWIPTNATILIKSTEQAVKQRYIFEVGPTNTSLPAILTKRNLEMTVGDNNRRFQFNALVNPSNTVTVSTKLYVDNNSSVSPNTDSIFGGRYNAIRSNTVVIPDDNSIHYLNIEISISGHNNEPILLTSPNLIDDQMYYTNWFVQNARQFMPDFYWDIDAQQEFPIAPFHKLIDALSTIAGFSYDKYVEFFSYEESELLSLSDSSKKYSRNALIDPYFVDYEYLPWLAQFMGVKPRRNVADSTNSKILPSFESENDFVRWQIASGAYGVNSGGRDTLRQSAKVVLGKTKNGNTSTYSVAVTPRYANDPFQLRVQTLLNETPDVTVAGRESTAVLNAIEPSRPLGYKVTHTTAAAFYFTMGDVTLGVLGEASLSP